MGALFHRYFEIFYYLCDACRPCLDSSNFTVLAPINAKVNGVNCYLPRAAKIDIVTPPEVPKTVKKKSPAKSPRMARDKRRKHQHWQVTVYYADGEKFARVYIDRDRAQKFADRQRKSPVVKSTRILEVD
jgi:hypothetical protein